MAHLEHGDVGAEVNGVATRVRGVHRRTLTDSHREKEDLVGATVLRLVETLHCVEELLGFSRGQNVGCCVEVCSAQKHPFASLWWVVG